MYDAYIEIHCIEAYSMNPDKAALSDRPQKYKTEQTAINIVVKSGSSMKFFLGICRLHI